MDILGGEIEEKRFALVATGKPFSRPGHEFVGHCFVVPQGRSTAPLVADPSDSVDDRLVVPVAARVVGHGFRVLSAVGIFRTFYARRLAAYEQGIAGIEIHHPVVLDVDARDPIVRVRQEKGVIETDLQRSRFDDSVPVESALCVSQPQVPLSDHRDLVSRFFEQLRKCEHSGLDLERGVGRKDPNAVAESMNTGQKRKTGGRARRGGTVSVGEDQSFPRKAIYVGGGDQLRSVGSHVAVPYVIAVDEYDVGTLGSGFPECASGAQKRRSKKRGKKEAEDRLRRGFHGQHSSFSFSFLAGYRHGSNSAQSRSSAVGSAPHSPKGSGNSPVPPKRCPKVRMASARTVSG